ncbi:hypothetical protein L484_027365 [Morus notabilis]|uniref:Growth-regulating factor n=1 Tax=Morus notabilis TaxID=981085 RepID=W9QJY3_9ROSA|nr:hypothetical protein L484_027365 [Morus notabilis]
MSGRNRFPFTASQWQELEHQALIFKYMASGIPIPPDLLFTIKNSYLDSSLSSKLLIPQHVGWNCFQMGLGKKIDPEPGRCRRTDGKKWRCSKEAFPDSKYCERHMHRGKNRSRKPVEVFKSPTTSASQTPISSSSSITHKNNLSNMITTTSTQTQTPNSNNSLSSVSYDSQNRHNLQYPCYNNSLVYHHHPHHTSSSRPHHGMIGLPSQDSNTSLLFDSDLRRNRYHHVYGMREVDRDDHDHEHEHAFFSEEPSSGTITRGFSSMDDSWQLTPVLSMSCSSSSSSKQRSTCSGLQNEHSYLQLQSASTQAYYKQQEHCDLKKVERKEEIAQKTIHFFDEWPVKEKDSWLDLDDKSSNSGSVSTTQLSISIPNTNSSSYDFPIFGSRIHNGN